MASVQSLRQDLETRSGHGMKFVSHESSSIVLLWRGWRLKKGRNATTTVCSSHGSNKREECRKKESSQSINPSIHQSRSSFFSSFPAAAAGAAPPGVGTSTFSPSLGCSVKTTTNSGSSVERFLRTYLSECVLCVSKNEGHVISLPGPCANGIVVFSGDVWRGRWSLPESRGEQIKRLTEVVGRPRS